MSRGICGFLWQLAVAMYLFANGVLGLQKSTAGTFVTILRRMGFTGDTLSLLVIVVSIIALIAGIAVLLDLFSVELPFLNTLVLVVAIIWVAYIVITLVSWITGGFKAFIAELQTLAINTMVLASLLAATKRFG